MRELLFTALLLAGAANADSAPKRAPARTLSALIDRAIQLGDSGAVGPDDRRILPMPLGAPIRTIRYDQGQIDGYEHVFDVVMKGELPQLVRLTILNRKRRQEGEFTEGRSLLMSPEGHFIRGSHFRGLSGRLVENELSADVAKRALSAEKRFWLIETAGKEYKYR